ncbi:MAG: hypothetical protein LC637_10080 [Xanthomonadaceae bacterium]|nr:hypothetical protein [Xanthomonadaceae bacterium]
MNLYSAIVAAIAIWGVVRVTQLWLAGKRQAKSQSVHAGQQHAIEDLESRIRTLERIVIDDQGALKRKFDDL